MHNEPNIKSAGQILLIPNELIHSNPNQPRKYYANAEMEELTQSIRRNGIIQPISVKRTSADEYELIAGERRLRAARLVGVRNIPCIVMNVGETKASIYALIENIQRCDLHFFEEAEGIREALRLSDMTQEEFAKTMGKSQSYISNKLRLLRLNEEFRKTIIEAGLTERHARCLLCLENDDQIERVLSIMADKHLSVKDSETLIRNILNRSNKKTKPTIKVFKDVRLFINTLNHAVDTMRKAGIDADSVKSETDTYIEYVVRIPKLSNLAIKVGTGETAA